MNKPKRLALLIGNNRYTPKSKFSSLATPKQNVLDLEKELKQHGNFDDVKRLIDPTHAEMDKKIKIFFSSEANINDVLLLYFSGHGERARSGKEELYLAVKDTNNSKDDKLRTTGIKAHDIKEVMNACPAHSKILILDCCKSGHIGGEMSGQNDSDELGNPFYTGKGTIILAAAGRTQTAWEGQIAGLKNSLFTHYLITGLRNGLEADKEYVTVYEWFQYARKQVNVETKRLSETNSKISPQNPRLFITEEEQSITIARNPRYDLKEPKVILPSSDDLEQDKSQLKKLLWVGIPSGLLFLLGILISISSSIRYFRLF